MRTIELRQTEEMIRREQGPPEIRAAFEITDIHASTSPLVALGSKHLRGEGRQTLFHAIAAQLFLGDNKIIDESASKYEREFAQSQDLTIEDLRTRLSPSNPTPEYEEIIRLLQTSITQKKGVKTLPTPIIIIWESESPTIVCADGQELSSLHIGGRDHRIYGDPTFVLARRQRGGQLHYEPLEVSPTGRVHGGPEIGGIKFHNINARGIVLTSPITRLKVLKELIRRYQEDPNDPLLTYDGCQMVERNAILHQGKKANLKINSDSGYSDPRNDRSLLLSGGGPVTIFHEAVHEPYGVDDLEIRAGMPVHSARVLINAKAGSSGDGGSSKAGHAALILRSGEHQYHHISLYHPGEETKTCSWLTNICCSKEAVLYESYHRVDRVDTDERARLLGPGSCQAIELDEQGVARSSRTVRVNGEEITKTIPENKRYPHLVIEVYPPSLAKKNKLIDRCEGDQDLINNNRGRLDELDAKAVREMEAMVAYYQNYRKHNPRWSLLPLCWPKQHNCSTLVRNTLAAGGASSGSCSTLFAKGVYGGHFRKWLGYKAGIEAILFGVSYGVIHGLDSHLGEELNGGEEVLLAVGLIFLRLIMLKVIALLAETLFCCHSETSVEGLRKDLTNWATDRSGRANIVHTRDTLNSTVVITSAIQHQPQAQTVANQGADGSGSPEKETIHEARDSDKPDEVVGQAFADGRSSSPRSDASLDFQAEATPLPGQPVATSVSEQLSDINHPSLRADHSSKGTISKAGAPSIVSPNISASFHSLVAGQPTVLDPRSFRMGASGGSPA